MPKVKKVYDKEYERDRKRTYRTKTKTKIKKIYKSKNNPDTSYEGGSGGVMLYFKVYFNDNNVVKIKGVNSKTVEEAEERLRHHYNNILKMEFIEKK